MAGIPPPTAGSIIGVHQMDNSAATDRSARCATAATTPAAVSLSPERDLRREGKGIKAVKKEKIPLSKQGTEGESQ